MVSTHPSKRRLQRHGKLQTVVDNDAPARDQPKPSGRRRPGQPRGYYNEDGVFVDHPDAKPPAREKAPNPTEPYVAICAFKFNGRMIRKGFGFDPIALNCSASKLGQLLRHRFIRPRIDAGIPVSGATATQDAMLVPHLNQLKEDN